MDKIAVLNVLDNLEEIENFGAKYEDTVFHIYLTKEVFDGILNNPVVLLALKKT